jgi:hypothetical protein
MEYSFGLGVLSDGGVHAFNDIGGIDHLAYF